MCIIFDEVDGIARQRERAVVFGDKLLVRDGGFNGTVVFLHAALNTLRLESLTDAATNLDEVIYAEAGVASPKVARFAANLGCDAAFMAGIPGTVGGALAMSDRRYRVRRNAKAQETKEA